MQGSHNIKIGGEYHYVTMERAAANLARGRHRFSGRESGFGEASFMLGLPTTSETAEGLPRTFVSAVRQGAYIQDDWKATSRLTVNLGLRFDYNGNPKDDVGLWRTINFIDEDVPEGRDAFNGAGFVDPATGQRVVTMGPEFVDDERGGVKLWKQDVKFFMPRVGIAYRPADKWVVRAGAGWFDNLMHQNNFTILNLNPPLSGSAEFQNVTDIDQSVSVAGANGEQFTVQTRRFRPDQPVITFDDPFLEETGGEPEPRPVNTLHVKPDYKDGDVWKWSFDIQREVFRNSSVTIGYVGSKGSHVANSLRNWNNASPSPDTNVQDRRPFPRFFDPATPELGVQPLNVIRYLDSYGNSFHHGLQLEFERRYSNGLAFGLSYTLSKSHGDGEAGGNESINIQTPRTNRRDARGRFRFDQRHNFVGHWVWEIPGAGLQSPPRPDQTRPRASDRSRPCRTAC